MAFIFGETAVFGIEDPKPARLTIEDFANNENLWLTDIRGGAKPNYQLMYAVGSDVYLNAFNQRLAQFDIQGIHILNNCAGAFQTTGDPPFLDFYKDNNIIQRTNPLKITFEGIVITGWMVEVAIGAYSQESVDGHRFGLTFIGTINGLQNDPPGVRSLEDQVDQEAFGIITARDRAEAQPDATSANEFATARANALRNPSIFQAAARLRRQAAVGTVGVVSPTSPLRNL
jgi:hypothetical protein